MPHAAGGEESEIRAARSLTVDCVLGLAVLCNNVTSLVVCCAAVQGNTGIGVEFGRTKLPREHDGDRSKQTNTFSRNSEFQAWRLEKRFEDPKSIGNCKT